MSCFTRGRPSDSRRRRRLVGHRAAGQSSRRACQRVEVSGSLALSGHPFRRPPAESRRGAPRMTTRRRVGPAAVAPAVVRRPLGQQLGRGQLRAGEAPAPSVGSGGYRREEAARSGGYGRGPPPPRDLRPPREAGSGPPRLTSSRPAQRRQQLGAWQRDCAGRPEHAALASGTAPPSAGQRARPEAGRGEARPPAGRENQSSAPQLRRGDTCSPMRHRACPRGGGCSPVQCVRGHSCAPSALPPHVPRCDKCDGPARTAAPPSSAGRDRHPDAAPARDKHLGGASGPVEILRSARVVRRTHARHPRHGTQDARTERATMHARCTRAHAHLRARTPRGRPGSRPARHSAPSFHRSSLHRKSALVSVCRCGSRVTAPVSSTHSPTDCATARRRTRCDGGWPRSYSPFDPNPEPVPIRSRSCTRTQPPRPNIPTPTPASGGLTLTLTLPGGQFHRVQPDPHDLGLAAERLGACQP